MGLFAGKQQFKAAHHVHTTNSDGSVLFANMVEAYYAQDYDLLAITDHNIVTRSWVNPPTANGLSSARAAQIAAGSDRGNRPMLMIPDTTEQSRTASPVDHINTFMADTLSTDWPTLLTAVAGLDGVAHINHLGRYVTDPTDVGRYIQLLTTYPYCVGIEMISYHYITNNDRRHWDNINSATVPDGRVVWGFANDDSHTTAEVGQCWNVMVMPANTIAELRAAMRAGSFYGIARVTSFEGVTTPVGLPPVIDDIDVAASHITIDAQNYTRIDWITEGTQKIAEGDTLNLISRPPGIGRFVRANVVGTGGVAFTQPFVVAASPVVPRSRMAIEVRGRIHVPHAPIDDDEVARKADLGTGGTLTGELKGDVTGPADATHVEALQGRPISSVAPEIGQVLLWTGSMWMPVSLPIDAITVFDADVPGGPTEWDIDAPGGPTFWDLP